MPKIKLKPCLLCGGENVYIPHNIDGNHCCEVFCPDCGRTFIFERNDLSENKIAKAWNTRADNKNSEKV